MNSHEEIFIKENIIQNNVPLHNVEYKQIKNNGDYMYIDGKINNKSFSYINPILKKHTKGKSKNKYKGKHFKKKTVRFKKDLSSTENVGMPTLEPIMSKKKRKNTRKPKKSSTSKNSKKKIEFLCICSASRVQEFKTSKIP